MNNDIQVFDNLKVKEVNGQVMFDAESAAIGLGITSTAKGYTNVRWSRINDYLNSATTGRKVGKGDFITEPQFYKLAIKANNETAERFQDWVTEEVLPSIRKTGGYQTKPALRLPQTNAEMLQVIQSANEEQNKRIDEVETTVDELKDRFGLPASQAKSLEQARKRHIVTLLGGFESNAYQHLSGKTFRQIGGDFKDYFEVPRYDALPLSKFDEGMSYIKAWQLPTNLALQVRDLNLQTELEV
ncbi:ORF6C domain-containing protein [Weissella paramesenteroides]|uniref:ORF6C domain-containing protein n=1 Tax=Weissella paramesenteroides TaxID=1249 RepID=UPI0023A9A075|nr:ORF6C domain-containing protein [Weissella paramesenteroides]WEA52275.1 ORF6C domain-containing protein [Weissella paramesenteroides]